MDITPSLEEYTGAKNKDLESQRKAILLKAKGRDDILRRASPTVLNEPSSNDKDREVITVLGDITVI